MSKGLAGVILAGGALHPTGTTPLYAQLYEGIRAAILGGSLGAGTRLPSTRTLAGDLGVSRNTVLSVFARLTDEGYLRAGVGDGTYVAAIAPEFLLQTGASDSFHAPQQATSTVERMPRLSARSERVQTTAAALRAAFREVPERSASRELLAFEDGVPALDAFPFELWGQLLSRRWKESGSQLLDYAAPQGYAPLREAVAQYLATARGVRCEASQVIITSGAQGALTLAARALLDEGDPVWLEDPGYLGARGAFQSAGAHLVPVPLDSQGLDLPLALSDPAEFPTPRVVFITPSHQFPLGVTMSLPRRLALLEWADKSGVWLIEDDYDSEFRYAGRPIPALQGLDGAGRVIYCGTFSKVLFPALRLGYMVLPPSLVGPLSTSRALSDLHGPLLEQAVVTDFLQQGHFGRHLRRMRALYAARQTALLAAAQREPGGQLRLEAKAAGMHLIGWLPEGSDDRETARLALRAGVRTQALSQYSLRFAPRPALMLGYTAFDETQLQAGVKQLAQVLERAA